MKHILHNLLFKKIVLRNVVVLIYLLKETTTLETTTYPETTTYKETTGWCIFYYNCFLTLSRLISYNIILGYFLDFSKVVNLKGYFIKTQLWLSPKNLSECIMNGLLILNEHF